MKVWKLVAGAIALVMGGFAAGYYVGTHYEVSFDVDRDEDDEERVNPVFLPYPAMTPSESAVAQKQPDGSIRYRVVTEKPSLEDAYVEAVKAYVQDTHIEVIDDEDMDTDNIPSGYEMEFVTYFWNQGVGYVDGADEIWNSDETEDFIGTPEIWRADHTWLEDGYIFYVKNTDLRIIYEITVKMDDVEV